MTPVARRAVGPALILGAGLIMLRWTWLKWPEVHLDFGRELYVAWRLAVGDVLYRDISHLKGPLAQYMNAALFRLFGVGLMTVVVANLVILVGLTCALYRLLVEIADRGSATVACLIFVSLFAFGHLIETGSDNFVCPYSHEVTYGVTLGVWALYCLLRYHRGQRVGFLWGAGLAVGLASLTDPQVFPAVAASLLVGCVLTHWIERPGQARLLRAYAGIVAAAILPLIAAWGFLATAMPPGQALSAIFRGLSPVTVGRALSYPFYAWGMGTDHLGESLQKCALWTGWYLFLFVSAAGLGVGLRKLSAFWARLIAFVLFAFVAAGIWYRRNFIQWEDCARPLPLMLIVLATIEAVALWKSRHDVAQSRGRILRLAMLTFAVMLLSKMFFFTRIWHYGFALAMPATLLFVVALLNWMPALLSGRGWSGSFFRAVALGALCAVAAYHLRRTQIMLDLQSVAVGHGADAFLSDQRGQYVGWAVERLTATMRPEETLAVLSEGAMINYLARRVNPTPYLNVMPWTLASFGSNSVLDSYRRHPPDWIVLVHKDTSEQGARFFGRDYAQDLFAWIIAHYHGEMQAGALPFQSDEFGISIAQRADQRE